jgi:hypothetical protein
MARNYGRLVQQLRSERSALEREVARLTQAISALEGKEGRGRQGGSLRMKKYWAARRKKSE